MVTSLLHGKAAMSAGFVVESMVINSEEHYSYFKRKQ